MMIFCFALLSFSSAAFLHGVCVSGYKPPSVSLSVYNHTGPMFAGHQYILLCNVHNVAPVENLAVTFYRGQTPLGQPQFSNNTQTKPVTEDYTQIINPSKEDDGAQYWCEAELQLGPEGKQRPPVVISENITTTVYYMPQVIHPSDTKMAVTAGRPVQLNCSARGNPRPSYAWTFPAHRSPSTGSVLTINSVVFEDRGQYTCLVSNAVGSTKVLFQLEVRGNFMLPIIILATGLLLVIVTIIVLFCIFQFTWL